MAELNIQSSVETKIDLSVKNCQNTIQNNTIFEELKIMNNTRKKDYISESNSSEESIEYDTVRLSLEDKQKMIYELNLLIDRFVDNFKHFPKQKSPEWVKLRSNGMGGVFLGGSDIATAIDVNVYQSPGQLIRSKCGFKTSRDTSDPIAMHWGSLFEDVIARYIELDFKTTMKGTEMIICGHKLYRYSPDGFIVACIKMINGEITIVSLDDPEGIPAIILCEIKSLWARKSKDSIPKYYIPQPLAGLEVAHLAYMALYVEGLFKVCNMNDLGSNKSYSKLIHTRQQFLNMYPIAWGMFFIYSKDEEEYNEFIKLYDAQTDVGKFNLESFKQIMKKIDSGTYITEFTDPKPYSPEAIELLYNQAESREDEKYFLGVIPWKLFDIHYFQMDRDPEYIPSVAKSLRDVNLLIQQAKKIDTDKSREEFIVKEMERLNISDDERGISESLSSPGIYRSAEEQNFLNSL